MNDKEFSLPAHSALVTIRKYFKCDRGCISVLKKLCIVPTSLLVFCTTTPVSTDLNLSNLTKYLVLRTQSRRCSLNHYSFSTAKRFYFLYPSAIMITLVSIPIRSQNFSVFKSLELSEVYHEFRKECIANSLQTVTAAAVELGAIFK
jgi:hypothetical protein